MGKYPGPLGPFERLFWAQGPGPVKKVFWALGPGPVEKFTFRRMTLENSLRKPSLVRIQLFTDNLLDGSPGPEADSWASFTGSEVALHWEASKKYLRVVTGSNYGYYAGQYQNQENDLQFL